MSDRYASVSVHGLMPLVADPDTGALRFAVLETDAPEDCLSSPEGLPEALVQFFVFGDESHARAWAAGIEEVASNAVSVHFPAVRFPSFAMLVRHDAEPLRGPTLEDCVALRYVGHRHDQRHPSAAAAENRRNEIERRREQGVEEAFRERWAPEIALVEACPDAQASFDKRDGLGPDAPLTFQLRDSRGGFGTGVRYRVTSTPSGHAVAWDEWTDLPKALDADLHARLVSEATAMGLTLDGSTLSRPLASIDAASLDAVGADDDAFSDRVAVAKRVQKGRELAVLHLVNEKMVSIVKRAVAGFPLVTNANRGDIDQASPTTGRGMTVPQVHFRSAVDAGLLVGAWSWKDPLWGDMHVFVATEAGRLLLSEDPTEHAEAFVEADRNRGDRSPSRDFVPRSSVAEAVPVLPEPPARALKALSSELDGAIERVAKFTADRASWATIYAAVAHGLAEFGSNGIPHRRNM